MNTKKDPPKNESSARQPMLGAYSKTKKSNLTTSGIPGVGRPTRTVREQAPEKLTPIAAKEIKSGVSASKEMKKPNVTLPVPGKKRRLIRRK